MKPTGRPQPPRRPRRERGLRGPWAVICTAATVVLGPAAVTASALDQANAAPLHHAVKAPDPLNPGARSHSLKRSHSRGYRSASTASFSKSTAVPSGSAAAGAMPRSGATVPVSCS